MPEIIDKDLLIKVLRYLNASSGPKIIRTPINIRKSTYDVAINILRNKGFINKKNLLNSKGHSFLKRNGLNNLIECRYSTFGYSYAGKNGSVEDKVIEILKKRPNPNYRLDQQPLSPQLTIMRAKYIASEENLFDKKIAFVGDYDSTNVALSMISKNRESFVFDIDKRLLTFFRGIARKNLYKINTVYCDVFKCKSRKYYNKFDVIVTDPPYAMGGIKKFIEFSISLLKIGGVGFIAVPYHENILWTEHILFEVIKLLVDNNCLVTDNKKNFYYYVGADNLRSSMIRFKKIKNENPIDISKLYSYKEKNINVPIINTHENTNE